MELMTSARIDDAAILLRAHQFYSRNEIIAQKQNENTDRNIIMKTIRI